MAKIRLTERMAVRSGVSEKSLAGHSDPVVLYGKAIAHRIKGTLGITGLYPFRVHINGDAWHLDVDYSHPGGEEAPKGSTVRRLKWNLSWV